MAIYTLSLSLKQVSEKRCRCVVRCCFLLLLDGACRCHIVLVAVRLALTSKKQKSGANGMISERYSRNRFNTSQWDDGKDTHELFNDEGIAFKVAAYTPIAVAFSVFVLLCVRKKKFYSFSR
jgi:hypothetical protein